MKITEEYRDEVTGKLRKYSPLNKNKVSKHELDEIFLEF